MERQKNIHSTIGEIKKRLGLDMIPVIHPPIPVKKDGKHLYQVCGYNYPMRPETLERLHIPPQKILYEVDREQWHTEMDDTKKKDSKKIVARKNKRNRAA